MNEPITKRAAEYFREQCIGKIDELRPPNNNLFKMFVKYGQYDDWKEVFTSPKPFATFLRQMADALDEDKT